MTEQRIVSLIASATEIVAALGFEESLVGRSHECDYPHSIEHLPICSEPKIDVRGTSRQIDDRVKRALQDALSIYRVHPQQLKDLKPTVIVTQTQCEVCAVSLSEVKRAVCEIVGSMPRIIPLEPNDLTSVWQDIQRVAEALSVPSRADSLIDALRSRLNALSAQVEKTPRPSFDRLPRVD